MVAVQVTLVKLTAFNHSLTDLIVAVIYGHSVTLHCVLWCALGRWITVCEADGQTGYRYIF